MNATHQDSLTDNGEVSTNRKGVSPNGTPLITRLTIEWREGELPVITTDDTWGKLTPKRISEIEMLLYRHLHFRKVNMRKELRDG